MADIVLEPEFMLLVRCCQWNFASSGEAARPEIPPNRDWQQVVALARRHRVQGLAWNALAPFGDQMPSDAREALSGDARSIAAANLAIAEECGALLAAIEKAEVPLLFVKGLSVAALAYRSPLLKMAWDIDLLIDPKDLAKAADLLGNLGYELRLPAERASLSTWHERSKESVWHRDDRFHVELHTRLADNPRLIPAINMSSPTRHVEISPSFTLPTLAKDELLAYLAVHGASSAWFRLKWISDFAALLAGPSGPELERLYDRSQQLGAARAFGQALLLADRLFDTLRPNPGLKKRLSVDRDVKILCRAALRMMIANDGDPTDRPLGTWPIHWTQFLLMPGCGYKSSELRRQLGLFRLRL